MVTREQIVSEARSWVDTPYRHQGRLKGIAVDCAGLVVCVVRACGLAAQDVAGYSRRPDGSLADVVYAQTLPVGVGAQLPGDVVLFHWDNTPTHLAFLTDADSIIHAFAINRRVCEHRIDDKWRSHIMAYRKISGIE
ncbi:NlpC/P60 family protein [Paraburkholderia caballeronis]|uniref:NlpC/P60 family protein n=1 Tax=Paraburkholderia caballeronis TaxID=416943 RepID=UPI0010646BAF|nr:NlpC/P60 family protein [Paraburkholderia caballeronis]TDV04694.1 NlpC/P60 family protein [Paraburkholderia caballeronis]TDV07937.1 NlpC/P60 family protein [Paraburkholderia caballeronis]TDV18228.1 NlpC/P60 family protein [Paraburkholderia caballeronis]